MKDKSLKTAAMLHVVLLLQIENGSVNIVILSLENTTGFTARSMKSMCGEESCFNCSQPNYIELGTISIPVDRRTSIPLCKTQTRA